MDNITKDTIINLLENCEGDAVSIYLPTYITTRDVLQNPIRLKNMIKEVENRFAEQGMGEGAIENYLSPVRDLVDDEVFWQEQNEGLAIFLDDNDLRYYKLPEKVEEKAIVSNPFHITPLIPIYQDNGPYFLLSISQERPRLFRGSKFNMTHVDELDLPASLQEMFDHFYEFHNVLQFHNSTISPNTQMPNDRHGMFFGQGGGDDDNIKAEILNFFHRFDEALMDYLDDSNVPLVLAGLGHIQPLYKQANTYPHLTEKGIMKDVSHMPVEELHQLSWSIVKPKYMSDVDKAIGIYKSMAEKNGETSSDVATIVAAAYYKRIHTLFVCENCHVWGTFKPQANKVKIKAEYSSRSQDLLSLAVANTLVNGGNIYIVQDEKMPERSKAAAILHY